MQLMAVLPPKITPQPTAGFLPALALAIAQKLKSIPQST